MRKLCAVVVLLAGLAGSACALHMDAELLNPFNRKVAARGEEALVAYAVRLLGAGAAAEAAVQNLVDQGQAPEAAHRAVAVALARIAKKEAVK